MKKNFFMRRLVCVVLSIVLLLLPFAMPVAASETVFTDVPEDHWAYDYIKDFSDLKIVDGYPDGTFKPEKEVTTAEFIKMVSIIYRMAFGGKYKGTLESYVDENGERKLREKPISEVYRGHWAERYVQSLDLEIHGDQYTIERLNRAITREEAAYILWRCYALTNFTDPNFETPDKTEKYIKQYEDESDISESLWNYRECLNACVQYGFFNGFDDGKLRPQGNLTRAQAAKIIYIYYDKLYSYMKYLNGSSWEWEH